MQDYAFFLYGDLAPYVKFIQPHHLGRNGKTFEHYARICLPDGISSACLLFGRY